ncbi:hypothetical protein MA16_Dca024388 [Dendrobium catenatum]|uniref:Uncharacterized protein n=1 Tax=Dendrobium catenatum TaxID=906689 RepID=A0A2I0WVX5_9ASPA|nr:hypothetical protein MA16_Dca024388 [Dendrobium catenatum]
MFLVIKKETKDKAGLQAWVRRSREGSDTGGSVWVVVGTGAGAWSEQSTPDKHAGWWIETDPQVSGIQQHRAAVLSSGQHRIISRRRRRWVKAEYKTSSHGSARRWRIAWAAVSRAETGRTSVRCAGVVEPTGCPENFLHGPGLSILRFIGDFYVWRLFDECKVEGGPGGPGARLANAGIEPTTGCLDGEELVGLRSGTEFEFHGNSCKALSVGPDDTHLHPGDGEPQGAEEEEAPAPIPKPAPLCQHSQFDQLVERFDRLETRFDPFVAHQ